MEKRNLRSPYGGSFYFRQGGRCGDYCDPDNYDKRRRTLLGTQEIPEPNAPANLSIISGIEHSSEEHRRLAACTEKEYRVVYLSFARRGHFKRWTWGNRRSQSNGFTEFFGPFYNGNSPYRKFGDIPDDADQVSVQFTFYEIDDWSKCFMSTFQYAYFCVNPFDALSQEKVKEIA
eukprot:CAMPEP_0202456984 /NCGR_PEP_ID=MMETSP1360-20130828/14114_1 /ASSEMBLY_ACC=CAM_ASM_000848 /TAXON_ID=515479 /ORGANISM="Licmophora paradoxa, Strain CCMP2313" /LENGTH=174 /DNA_ID=CAMNT_0049076947 /DNA_START=108 /DNA_END=632 /DNA_ORIENTATION=+